MIPSDLKIKQTGGFNCTVSDLNKAITGFEKAGHTVICERCKVAREITYWVLCMFANLKRIQNVFK